MPLPCLPRLPLAPSACPSWPARACHAFISSPLCPAACCLQLGLVGPERAASFAARKQQIEETEALLDSIRLSSSAWARQGFTVAQDGGLISAAQMLTRPGTSLAQLAAAVEAEGLPGWQELAELAGGQGEGAAAASSGSRIGRIGAGVSAGSSSAVATAVYNCHYRPYLRKMEAEVADLRRDEALRIPEGLDYGQMQLSAEDMEKLSAARPASLAAAQRLGVTPSALLMLLQHVRKRQARGGSGSTDGGGQGSSSGGGSDSPLRVAQEAAAEAGVGT